MSSSLVLITGVSGFIGFATLIRALESGYKVRAVVRKESQIEKLKHTLPKTAPADNVEFVVIPDLAVEGAFDKFLKDVTYIIHIASPMPSTEMEILDIEKKMFLPAINNSTNILVAASKFSSVKRIVMTSSCAAIVSLSDFLSGTLQPEYTNNTEIQHYETSVQLPHPVLAYSASKAMALEAAESWVSTHKPSFDLVSILPTMVVGPDLLTTTVDDYATHGSTGALVSLIMGKKDATAPLASSVSLDDTTKLHVLALDEKLKVPAGRYLAGAGMDWNDAIATLKKEFPEEIKQGKIHLDGNVKSLAMNSNSEETEKVFGFKLESYEVMVKSVAEYFLTLKA